jgi:hypothetical protein
MKTIGHMKVCVVFEILKSKYLFFFPSRRVFRHAGMDGTVPSQGCEAPNEHLESERLPFSMRQGGAKLLPHCRVG